MQYGTQSAFDGAAALGMMLLAGAAMGVFYDVFRVFRRFFRCGYSLIFVQDTLFFIVSAIGIFFAGITFSGGKMRVSFVAAALAGWLTYSLTAGAAVMFVIDKILALIHRLSGRIWSVLSCSAGILPPDEKNRDRLT